MHPGESRQISRQLTDTSTSRFLTKNLWDHWHRSSDRPDALPVTQQTVSKHCGKLTASSTLSPLSVVFNSISNQLQVTYILNVISISLSDLFEHMLS